MQSETGFPNSHQLKSYVASKSRLKLAARAVLSADAGLLVDVVAEIIYECRSRPLCPPHLITLHYYSLLRFIVYHFTATSGSLQVCSEIIYNILIASE